MLREMMPAHEIMMKHERYKKIMLAKDLNSRDVRTWLGGYFWVSTQTPDKHLEDLPVNCNLENKLRKTVAPCSATLAVVWLCSCAKKYQQKQSQSWMQAFTGPKWLQQHKTTWTDRREGRQAVELCATSRKVNTVAWLFGCCRPW